MTNSSNRFAGRSLKSVADVAGGDGRGDRLGARVAAHRRDRAMREEATGGRSPGRCWRHADDRSSVRMAVAARTRERDATDAANGRLKHAGTRRTPDGRRPSPVAPASRQDQ